MTWQNIHNSCQRVFNSTLYCHFNLEICFEMILLSKHRISPFCICVLSAVFYSFLSAQRQYCYSCCRFLDVSRNESIVRSQDYLTGLILAGRNPAATGIVWEFVKWGGEWRSKGGNWIKRRDLCNQYYSTVVHWLIIYIYIAIFCHGTSLNKPSVHVGTRTCDAGISSCWILIPATQVRVPTWPDVFFNHVLWQNNAIYIYIYIYIYNEEICLFLRVYRIGFQIEVFSEIFSDKIVFLRLMLCVSF